MPVALKKATVAGIRIHRRQRTVVQRHEDGGEGRRDYVEEEDESKRQGIVVNVQDRLGGGRQGYASDNGEDEGAPELKYVKPVLSRTTMSLIMVSAPSV